MERKQTKRKRKNTSSKRKASRHQFRPFGKFAEPLSTDTSDSDYVPDEFDDGEVDKKRKEDDDFVMELPENVPKYHLCSNIFWSQKIAFWNEN